MKTKFFILLTLVGVSVTGSVAMAANRPPVADSPISVVFVRPENFTDAKYARMDDTSTELLGEIQQCIRETGEKLVPSSLKLNIRVTDIDLAGDFEPWRGPGFSDIRIMRDIYIPRISLEYSLTDGAGRVVRSGHRQLRDLTYKMRLVSPQNDYLRYEKDLLREWLREEFRNTSD